MDTSFIDSLKEDNLYHEELQSNLWVMDDHRWAFHIWEQYRHTLENDRFSLVHIDYHYDAVNDFHENPDKKKELIESDLRQIYEFVKDDVYICFDSFIAPAIMRGYIEEVHFLCKQADTDLGIDQELLIENNTKQFLHNRIDELAAVDFRSPIIFDFCLDIFNNSDMWYEGDIMDNTGIMDIVCKCETMVKMASVVTVSLSFGYSGTEEHTRGLAKQILPIFSDWRNETKK